MHSIGFLLLEALRENINWVLFVVCLASLPLGIVLPVLGYIILGAVFLLVALFTLVFSVAFTDQKKWYR